MTVKIITLWLCLAACVFFWLWYRAERLTKRNRQLQAENQQQAAVIQQKTAEVKNAEIYKQNQQITQHSSAGDIDEQLHDKGYFRDDNNGVSVGKPSLKQRWMPCIKPYLSYTKLRVQNNGKSTS